MSLAVYTALAVLYCVLATAGVLDAKISIRILKLALNSKISER